MLASSLVIANEPVATSPAAPQAVPMADVQPQKGTVISNIEAGSYKYLEVKKSDKTLWIVTTNKTPKDGDVILFDEGMVMTNYASKTLNRTFDSVLFVNRLEVEGADANAAASLTLPPEHPSIEALQENLKNKNEAHATSHASSNAPHDATTASAAATVQKGTVLSTIDIENYTYLEIGQEIDGKQKTVWLATGTVAAKKGDSIEFLNGMTLNDYHSKSLNRTFSTIIFASAVAINPTAKAN